MHLTDTARQQIQNKINLLILGYIDSRLMPLRAKDFIPAIAEIDEGLIKIIEKITPNTKTSHLLQIKANLSKIQSPVQFFQLIEWANGSALELQQILMSAKSHKAALAEAVTYVKEVINTCRKTLLSLQALSVDAMPSIPQTVERFLQSQAMYFVKNSNQFDINVEIKESDVSSSHPIDELLARLIDQFILLDQTEPNNTQAFIGLYEKLIQISLLQELQYKEKKNISLLDPTAEDFSFYCKSLTLEYAIRIYCRVQAEKQETNASLLDDFKIHIIESIVALEELNKSAKSPKYFVVTEENLTFPWLSKYALPFVVSAAEKKIKVQLQDLTFAAEDDSSALFRQAATRFNRELWDNQIPSAVLTGYLKRVISRADRVDDRLEIFRNILLFGSDYLKLLYATSLWKVARDERVLKVFKTQEVRSSTLSMVASLMEVAFIKFERQLPGASVSQDNAFKAIYKLVMDAFSQDDEEDWVSTDDRFVFKIKLIDFTLEAANYFCKKAKTQIQFEQAYSQSYEYLGNCLNIIYKEKPKVLALLEATSDAEKKTIFNNLLQDMKASLFQLEKYKTELEEQIENIRLKKEDGAKSIEEINKKASVKSRAYYVNTGCTPIIKEPIPDVSIKSTKSIVQQNPEQALLDEIPVLLLQKSFDDVFNKIKVAKNKISNKRNIGNLHLSYAECCLGIAKDLFESLNLEQYLQNKSIHALTRNTSAIATLIYQYFNDAMKSMHEAATIPEAAYAAGMVLERAAKEYKDFDDAIKFFFQKSNTRKLSIMNHENWAKKDTGHARHMREFEDVVRKESLQRIDNLRKLSYTLDLNYKMNPLMKYVLDTLEERGDKVVLYGEFILDCIRKSSPRATDIAIVSNNPGNYMDFLHKKFGKENVKEHENDLFTLFTSGQRFTISLKIDKSLEEVQKEIAYKSAYCHGLSMVPGGCVVDISGNGISDAIHGIVDARGSLAANVQENVLNYLRHLLLVVNKNCSLPDWYVNLSLNDIHDIVKKLAAHKETPAFQSLMGEFFQRGHALFALNLLSTFGVLEFCYPSLFTNLKNEEFACKMRSSLQRLDDRANKTGEISLGEILPLLECEEKMLVKNSSAIKLFGVFKNYESKKTTTTHKEPDKTASYGMDK